VIVTDNVVGIFTVVLALGVNGICRPCSIGGGCDAVVIDEVRVIANRFYRGTE
jgi:hypothetical protein